MLNIRVNNTAFIKENINGFRSPSSKLKITNIKTGKSVIVTVNDRMAKYGKHTIDLSVGAFIKLAPRKQGVIKIKIEKI